MDISIIIPAYNESLKIESALLQVVDYMASLDKSYEIIVVDDGSKDNTYEIVKELLLTYPQLKLLKNNPNRGKGYSVKKGFLESKGDFLLFTDADMATPIKEIKKMLEFIPNYDLVLGSRRIVGSKIIHHQPLARIIAGKVFAFLVSFFVIKGISDTQCGFKMYKRGTAIKLARFQRKEGWAFDVEHLFLASKFNFKVKEVPVTWIDNRDSKLKFISSSLQMLKDIFSIRLNNFLGRYND